MIRTTTLRCFVPSASVDELWVSVEHNLIPLTEEFGPRKRMRHNQRLAWRGDAAGEAWRTKCRRYPDYVRTVYRADSMQRGYTAPYEQRLTSYVKEASRAYCTYVHSKSIIRAAFGNVESEGGEHARRLSFHYGALELYTWRERECGHLLPLFTPTQYERLN